MSYILDALKKAEEERRRGTAPDVMTVQDGGSAKARGLRPWLVYLLLAALLVNAGVFAWWLGPWNAAVPGTIQKAKSGAVTTAAVSVKGVADKGATVSSLPEKEGGTGLVKKADGEKGHKNLTPEKVKTAAEAGASPKAGKSATKVDLEKKPLISADSKDVTETTAKASTPLASDRIYALNQLPSSVREGLPRLTMSLHYFTDDPSLRIIRIDGETLREGQATAGGLRLEKITPDGAIFDYRHYRFSVGMGQQ
jgi:general secretion pathway protein B